MTSPAIVPRGNIALARREAVRLTTHPLVVTGCLAAMALSMRLGGLWTATVTSGSSPPFQSFSALTVLPSLVLGPFVFFAANLTASRERRAGTSELLAGTPLSPRARTAAALLAALGPAVLTALIIAVTLLFYHGIGAQPVRWPSVLELTMQPARVLGAGLLGVMVARWLPWPGSAAVTMVLLYAWSNIGPWIATYGTADATHTMRSAYLWISFAPFREVVTYRDPTLANVSPAFYGSIAWHDAYLLCLGAMAAVGALLATPGPRRPLLTAGTVAVAAAAFSGWRQLP
jgi:hypothetical protein